jgi:glycosyltransferase involved in cell wall biosynthesis
LDSIGPATWSRGLRRIREFSPDLAVIPWWHIFWAPHFGWLAWQLRRSDIEVLFLCHNVIGHEGGNWQRLIAKSVLSQADRFIVHSSADTSDLSTLLPSASIEMHPHPIHDDFPHPTKLLPRRARTELLFFGFIRPYKGLHVLLRALARLKEHDFRLTVVGEFWQGADQTIELVGRLGLWNKIEIVPRYVSDQQAAEYFARADAVVLPYLTATSSGVIPLAYHYNKPVLVSRLGGLTDVVEEGGTGLVVAPGSDHELADALARVMTTSDWWSAQRIMRMKERLTWKNYADAVLGQAGGKSSD